MSAEQLELRPMSESDARADAIAADLVLPPFYLAVLTSIGCGEAEWPPSSGWSIEILCPSEVLARFGPFFDDPTWIGTSYFPFGVDVKRQTMWVIDCSTHAVASIWHEYVPDEWAEAEWLSRNQWVEREGLTFLRHLR